MMVSLANPKTSIDAAVKVRKREVHMCHSICKEVELKVTFEIRRKHATRLSSQRLLTFLLFIAGHNLLWSYQLITN